MLACGFTYYVENVFAKNKQNRIAKKQSGMVFWRLFIMLVLVILEKLDI